MTTTTSKPKGSHVTFMEPVHVILQGKSTPIRSVTAYPVEIPAVVSESVSIRCKVIFVASSPSGVTAGMTIQTYRHNIAGIVEVDLS